MGRERTAIWLALILILLTTAMSAQTSRGTVIGVVTDPSGAVVANAKVTLTQQSTGVVRDAVTNSVGFFRFDAVNLGEHQVKVTASGFAVAVVPGIDVHANQISNADIKLQIGQSSQVVEVGAAADAITLQTTEQLRGENIETRALSEMPISGQNSLNLMTLAPGIVPTTLDGGQSLDSGIGSVNGARPRANNFMIDGVENNDISVAGPALTLTNNDALAEVSVQTSNFSAEFGRTGGAVVNQVTKSGTNKLHGTAAWVYKSSALNASSFDERISYFGGGKDNGDPLKAPFLEHLPAFTVGGPVYIPGVYDGRNKTFFFVAGQWDRSNNGSYQKIFTVPTAAGIQTLQSLAATCPNAKLYLNSIGSMVAATRSGAADLSVPQGVYDVTGSCTNSTRAGMTMEYGTATRTAPILFKGNTMQARVDHVVSDKQQLSFRFMSSPGSYPGVYPSGLALTPAFDAGYNSSSYTGAITDTYVLTPHLTNELRINYFRVGVDFPILAGTGSLGATLPSIGISGVSGLGTSSSFPQGRTFNNYELQDTMTWVRGNHTLRYGFDINKQIARQSAPVAVRGSLSYAKSISPLGTTSAFSNFLDDFSGPAANTAVTRQFGTPIYHPTVFRQSYFVQDSWKLTSQLTVNLGLRYDYFGQPANDNFTYPMVSLSPSNYPNATKLPVDRNNFGPTVGFAYNPRWGFFSDGKTVFRGGFQIGYDSWFNNLLSNMASAAPNNVSNLPRPATINSTTPRGVAGVYNQIFPTLVAAPLNSPLADTSNQFTPHMVNPYTMHWSLGVQRELASKLLMDVSYVGSVGRKLFATRDLNPRIPSADGTAGGRLNPLMGARAVRDSAGTSNYNSLQVEVRNKAMQTAVGGITFNSAWTWSHNLDQVSEVFATSGGQTAYGSSRWMALTNMNIDYGNSDLDRRHRWVTSVIWDVRGPKHGVLNQVLGGWTIIGSIPLMSGTPFNVSNDFDRDGDGSQWQDRPDIGNPHMPITSRAILDDTCPAGLRNPDTAGCTTADKVFWVQSATRPGAKTAKRNNVFSGGMISADVSFLKKFRIREGLNFEYRAEIFNIANHMNFNYPPTGVDDYGLLVDQDPGAFMNWNQSDYYTNPGYRSIRMGVKLIF